jgi:hypothetical protein
MNQESIILTQEYFQHSALLDLLMDSLEKIKRGNVEEDHEYDAKIKGMLDTFY